MTEQEVAKVLYLLNVNYDSRMTDSEMENKHKLWSAEFATEDARLVNRAVQMHISENDWFPKISHIKRNVAKLKEELSISVPRGGGVVIHVGNRTWFANDVSQVKVSPEQEAFLDALWNSLAEA